MAKKKEKLTEEFLTAHATSIYQGSVNWRTEKLTNRWKLDNDLYDSKFSLTEKQKSDVLLGQGRLFIPKTYSHVQRMLVDILDTFFNDIEEVVDITSWKNIPSETRSIVKALLNYRISGHPINLYQEMYEVCLDALKNKLGVLKVYPELTIEKDEFGEDKITKFEPKIECVPYEDMFFHAKATWKDYWKFPIVQRMVRSRDYLKRKKYKNLDLIKASNGDNEIDEIKIQRNDGTGGSPFNNTVKVEGQDNVYIYEIWTKLDINDDGLLEDVSYLMAGDSGGPKIIIRDAEENTLPYGGKPPYVAGPAFPEAHQLYGKSLPEIVEGLQRETNAIRNQDREATALAIRKPLLVNRGAGIDLMSLVNRRIGGVVLGDDISPNSVRELDVSNPNNNTQYAEATNNQNFYETTSIPPNLMGMPSSADETATAVTSHTANANKKIAQIIRNLAMTIFVPGMQMLLQLEQEYESDEFIMKVTGRELGWGFAQDSLPARDYIQGDFDLIVNIGMDKKVQINKFMLMMDRGSMVNQVQGQLLQMGVANPKDIHFVDLMAIYHRALASLGEKNYKEFMIQATPPPPPEGAGTQGIASQTGQSSTGQMAMEDMNPMAAEGMSAY